MTAARLLLVLVAAGVLGFYAGPYRDRQHDVAELAEVASVIAGRDVRIHCPGALAALTDVSSKDGTVAFSADGRPADEARLSSGTCSHLRSFLAGDVEGLDCLAIERRCPEAAERAAVAVNVLSHEAWHLFGVRNEAEAQCYALQTNAETALRLGATRDDAESVARFVAERIQPSLPPDYRTRDCYDGGPLDLHPERPHWP